MEVHGGSRSSGGLAPTHRHLFIQALLFAQLPLLVQGKHGGGGARCPGPSVYSCLFVLLVAVIQHEQEKQESAGPGGVSRV